MQKHKKYIQSRKLNSTKDIPQHWIKTIQSHVNILLKLGVKNVYLTGSRVNGTYRDDTTPEWFLEHMKQFGKEHFSDWDYITVPHIQYKLEGIDVLRQSRDTKIDVTNLL